jgi:hypothetical protein
VSSAPPGRQKGNSAPLLLNAENTMLSIRMGTLVAVWLTLSCWGLTQSYSATPAVSPNIVRHASAEELPIRRQHSTIKHRPDSISVALSQPKSDTAPGAPYSSATTPNVGSPEWKRDLAETARREKELARKLNGICRGC